MRRMLQITAICSVIFLAGCTQPPASVRDFGSRFFGKTDLASNVQFRMPQNPAIADKYKSATPEFDIAAPAPAVSISELPAPTAAVAPKSVPRIMAAAPVIASKPLAPKPVAAYAAPSAPKLETLAFDSGATLKASSLSSQPMSAPKTSFIWPANGQVISRFGPKANGLVNDGINIAAREGDPIWAAASGDVAYAGNELKGYGNMMIVKHAGGWMTAYAHASDMLVAKGDKVKQGDLIGYVGKTGEVTSAQLHFGIREGKTAIDPEKLLPRRVASVQ